AGGAHAPPPPRGQAETGRGPGGRGGGGGGGGGGEAAPRNFRPLTPRPSPPLAPWRFAASSSATAGEREKDPAPAARAESGTLCPWRSANHHGTPRRAFPTTRRTGNMRRRSHGHEDGTARRGSLARRTTRADQARQPGRLGEGERTVALRLRRSHGRGRHGRQGGARRHGPLDELSAHLQVARDQSAARQALDPSAEHHRRL